MITQDNDKTFNKGTEPLWRIVFCVEKVVSKVVLAGRVGILSTKGLRTYRNQLMTLMVICIVGCAKQTPDYVDECGNEYMIYTRCNKSGFEYTWGTGMGMGMDGKFGLITGYSWRNVCTEYIEDTILIKN